MTNISRKELIEQLDRVSPALASRDLVPQLTMYWFTGSTLMAYNGEIAISVPCETGFAGAVPKTLLGLLNASRSKELEITQGDSEITIRAGSTSPKTGKFSSRTKFKLPLRPAEDFMFAMPKMDKGAAELGDKCEKVLAGMSGCMRSLTGARSPVADQLGLTIIPNGKSVKFFATNAATISKADIPVDLKCQRRVILPEAFCKQALTFAKGAEKVRFTIGEDHALLTADRAVIFGRLLDSDKPYDFDKIIDHHYPSSAKKNSVEKPEGLKLALERAFVIVGKRMTSKFSASNGKLKIDSKSDVGEVYDSLKFKAAQDVSGNFEPELMLAGIETFDHLMLGGGCCVMTNDEGQLYMVAASSKS